MENKKKFKRREFLERSISVGLTIGCPLILKCSKQIDKIERTNNQYTKNPSNTIKRRAGNMVKCKITVLRRMFNEDFAKKYCQEEVTLCPVFSDGQEFIYDHYGDGSKPKGFCEHAWHGIYQTVMILSCNGTMKGWMKEEKSNIVCCTDGIRPVVFKIERI